MPGHWRRVKLFGMFWGVGGKRWRDKCGERVNLVVADLKIEGMKWKSTGGMPPSLREFGGWWNITILCGGFKKSKPSWHIFFNPSGSSTKYNYWKEKLKFIWCGLTMFDEINGRKWFIDYDCPMLSARNRLDSEVTRQVIGHVLPTFSSSHRIKDVAWCGRIGGNRVCWRVSQIEDVDNIDGLHLLA